MTTESKASESTELVDYEALLAGMAKQASSVEKPSSSSIGVRAGILTYGGQPVVGNKLDCIVIASTHTNLLYEGAFDPNNLSNPVCFAYSESGEDMTPHPASSKPQHSDCRSCPNNQWGSDPSGGKGKACKNGRRLAIIPADTKPEDVAAAEVATLALPVMSITNWSNYVHKCSALFSRPPLGVLTQIGTVPDAKSQFRVTFNYVSSLDKSLLMPLIQKAQDPAVREILERVYEPNAEKPEASGKAKKF